MPKLISTVVASLRLSFILCFSLVSQETVWISQMVSEHSELNWKPFMLHTMQELTVSIVRGKWNWNPFTALMWQFWWHSCIYDSLNTLVDTCVEQYSWLGELLVETTLQCSLKMPYYLVISANRIRGQWFSFSKVDVCHLWCCMCTAASSGGLALYVYMGRQWMIYMPRLGLPHIFPNLENTAWVSMLYVRTGIRLFVPCL